MELLLILTAFFASLTGVSGEHGVRPVPGVAVVRAAEVAQAAAQPARQFVAAAAALPGMASIATLPAVHRATAPRPALRLAFEQRRE